MSSSARGSQPEALTAPSHWAADDSRGNLADSATDHPLCYEDGFNGITNIDTTSHPSSFAGTSDQVNLGHLASGAFHCSSPSLEVSNHQDLNHVTLIGQTGIDAGHDVNYYPLNNTEYPTSVEGYGQAYSDTHAVLGTIGNSASLDATHVDSTSSHDPFICLRPGYLQYFDSFHECERHFGKHVDPVTLPNYSQGDDNCFLDRLTGVYSGVESNFSAGINDPFEDWSSEPNFAAQKLDAAPQGTVFTEFTDLGSFPAPASSVTDGPVVTAPSLQHASPLISQEYRGSNPRVAIQPAIRRRPAPTSARFPCGYPGCGRDFKHAGDRDRHFTDKHGDHGAGGFPCKFPDCDRNGTRAFGRKDKLRDHLRQKHNFNI